MEEDPEENDVKDNPRQKANPLSALTFWWLLPFFNKGYKHDYSATDLFKVLKQHESEALGDRLQTAWEYERRRSKAPSISWTLIKVFGPKIIFYGLFFGVLELVVKMIQPVAIGYLVSSFSPDQRNNSSEQIITYSSVIIVSSILSVLIYFPTLMGLCHCALKMKIALASLIYRKSLRLSLQSLDESGGTGHVVNLISSDVGRMDLMVLFIHNLWIGPLVTILATIIMYREIGGSAFVGVMLVLFFIPFQAWLTKISANIHKQAAIKTDERLALMCEIIKGIQVIKMYAWEKPFSRIIKELRNREIQLMKYASYIKGVHIAFTVFRSRTAIFASILAYVLLGNVLTAEKVFVVTACFNTMKRTMTDLFSYAIELLILARVSFHRIQRFLLLDESNAIATDLFEPYLENGKPNGDLNVLSVTNPHVILRDVNTHSDSEKNDFQLKNINIEILNPSLIAVIGQVGSGKTCLFNVILREKECYGKIDVRGKISYGAQESWLFNQTIKKNIILSEEYNEERYNNILEICCLVEDLQSLTNGDETWIGERGSTLSGGQRIRVNLARALYRKADIYLLDDPLSALDFHVAKHVFNGIRQFLKKKICILITHQHQFVCEVDHVIILNSGMITYQDSYKSLKDIIKNCVGTTKKSEEVNSGGEVKDGNGKKNVLVNNSRGRTGKVTWDVYKEYLKTFGHPCVVFIIVMLFILGQFSASSSDYFIGYWVNMEQAQHTNDSLEDGIGWYLVQESCIFVYSVLNVLTVFLTITSSFMFFNASMSAASRMHNKMFRSVVYTKMSFFNQTQTGNIVNRFTSDLKQIDETIPAAAVNCLQTSLSIFGVVGVVTAVQPWLMLPTIIAFGLLIVLRNIYIVVGSNLKRLEATTRSPMLCHVSSSLQGLTTIRSSNLLPRLQSEFDHLQNTHSTARYLVQSSARMFAMWLETTCVLLLIFLVSGYLIDTTTYGGNVGLAITQLMGMMGLIQWAVRQSSDLEACMTSVERVMEYCKLENEWKGTGGDVGMEWPEKGNIQFENVGFNYNGEEHEVLKDLNFTIQGGEKIGIVGRTGNGKTSIINALLKLYNISGTITIDDIDINTIEPQQLRASVAVIPQEPMIFSGSIRLNLDPGNKISDERLWRVLEITELKNCVLELGGGLEYRLSSGGTKLSTGQRQLLCAARAFLKDSKILILDEPTSSLDPETEEALERALHTYNTTRTVLTVAHRLENILRDDRIMVVGDGKVIEFDEPHLLLNTDGSYLRRLLQCDVDENTADKLKNIAKQV